MVTDRDRNVLPVSQNIRWGYSKIDADLVHLVLPHPDGDENLTSKAHNNLLQNWQDIVKNSLRQGIIVTVNFSDFVKYFYETKYKTHIINTLSSTNISYYPARYIANSPRLKEKSEIKIRIGGLHVFLSDLTEIPIPEEKKIYLSQIENYQKRRNELDGKGTEKPYSVLSWCVANDAMRIKELFEEIGITTHITIDPKISVGNLDMYSLYLFKEVFYKKKGFPGDIDCLYLRQPLIKT